MDTERLEELKKRSAELAERIGIIADELNRFDAELIDTMNEMAERNIRMLLAKDQNPEAFDD